MSGGMPKRKPRGRTEPATLDDLAALPPLTVLMDGGGDVFERWGDIGATDASWMAIGDAEYQPDSRIQLPARVLYRPYYAPWDD